MADVDEKAPVVLTSVSSELEGMLIVGKLEGEGILAKAAGALTAGWRAEVPGRVQVLVLRRDEVRAREFLKEWGLPRVK